MNSKLPTPSEELVEAAVKGVVSAIPFVGGLVAELGGCLVSPLDCRKRAWLEEVEIALDQLAEKFSLLPEALSEDPAFVTALLKATAAALATHRSEKTRALRAFLICVGSKALPDEELQHALLKLLEDLSVGHIDVLRFLLLEAVSIAARGSLEEIYDIYSTHNGGLDRMAFRWILADLSARMVIHLGDIEDMTEFASLQSTYLSPNSKTRPLQITHLGNELLKLLS